MTEQEWRRVCAEMEANRKGANAVLNSSPNAPAFRYVESSRLVPGRKSSSGAVATQADLDALCTGITSATAQAVKEFVRSEMEPLRRRIVQLEKQLGSDPPGDVKAWFDPLLERIAELEAREQKTLADSFVGPWLPQRLYRRGSLAQHGGNAWLALADTEGKPGEAEGWRLLVRGAR